ncbi:MAG: C4-type zinc ribbon domain-containing protein [Nitrospirae bacterium]|nr:C4-type zinc ribbon domain-containing protein [Nitrospirota bacterium]
MTEDLKVLMELQEIDSAIVEKTDVVTAIPGKVSSVERPLKEARAAYDKAKQLFDTLTKKKREKEHLLDETGEKIRKLRGRVSEIKTNKEYQAHLKEIESVEKEQRAVEDEVLAAMEDLDTAQKEMRALAAKVQGERAKIDAFKGKLQQEAAGIEKEIEALRGRREGLVKALDGETYDFYMKLLEAKRGSAVAEARDEVCRGCNMNIPPQLFVEIKKNEKIIQCPQCNRILFWKAEKG